MPNRARSKKDIRILLHDIRSAHNVGSMLRTAEAIGVSHAYLTGYTPLPVDRFKRPMKEISKTALGAEKLIPWEHAQGPDEIIGDLRDEGFEIVGIEQDARSVDYKSYVPNRRVLILLGSEVDGMTPSLRKECDALLQIPMYGAKESLNVSVAFGIALFHLFDGK